MGHRPVCLVCQKEMRPGFIPELDGIRIRLLRWGEGEPRKPFLTGEVKSSQYVGETLAITAYRCPECHALRLYAPDPE